MSKSDLQPYLWIKRSPEQTEGQARRHKADLFSNVESDIFLRLVTSASHALADLCTLPSPDGDSPAGEQYEVFKQVHHKRPHMRYDSKDKEGKVQESSTFFSFSFSTKYIIFSLNTLLLNVICKLWQTRMSSNSFVSSL